MKRGTVVLAVLPFTDLTAQKHRPALIISPESRAGHDVLLAFITPYKGEPLDPAELLISIDDPDFSETGLKIASVLRLNKLFTLHKTLIIGKLGSLSPRLMDRVNECLRLALAL